MMDKQQGTIAEHRELYSISCNKPQWKRKKIKYNSSFGEKRNLTELPSPFHHVTVQELCDSEEGPSPNKMLAP